MTTVFMSARDWDCSEKDTVTVPSLLVRSQAFFHEKVLDVNR